MAGCGPADAARPGRAVTAAGPRLRPSDVAVIRVYVVHGHPVLREALAEALAREPDLVVAGSAADPPSGLAVRAGIDVLLLGSPWYGGPDGLVARCRAAFPGARIVGLYTTERVRREFFSGGADAAIDAAAGKAALLAAIRSVAD